MGQASTRSVVRQIEVLFDGGSAAGLSDRQLLERFAAGRDSAAEAAFGALVARHGSMVMRVCRDLVRDEHHGEDAFQAVFLVLACKAKSIRDPARLGNWLFGVAVRTALVMLLVVELAFLGAAGAAYAMHAPTLQQEPKTAKAKPEERRAANPENTQQQPAAGRMFIVGRVLDPEGKPVAGATVMAYARTPLPGRAGDRCTIDPVSIGHAQSDGSGKFHLDAARTSSSRNDGFGAVARAAGFGAGWVALDADAEQPAADILLRTEQAIEVRLFDMQGRPAQGVTVSVSAIRRIVERNPIAYRERLEGPAFPRADASDLRGWPGPITDAEGRITVHGIGRGLRVLLTVRDPRYATQDISIETDDPGNTKQFTMALQPAKIINGRVTYTDTGKPVPHARVTVGAESAGEPGVRSTSFQADDEGRFRANPSPGDRFRVYAYPPPGQPYMSVIKTFDWPKGAVENRVDLALSRGMLIRGKVTERGSGKPVAGALLSFNSVFVRGTSSSNLSTQAETAADGSYQLVAVPRAGYLSVRGPGDDYVLDSLGDELLFNDKPGGRRFYSNGFVRCEPMGDGADLEIAVELRRGVTVTGELIAPEGRPAQETWMISRIIHGQPRSARRDWRGEDHAVVRNGRFELHGLDQDAEVPVCFLDAKRKLGATVSFSGRMAPSGRVNVRLEPCGSARLRLVDAAGKPVAQFTAPRLVMMVVTPGVLAVGRAPTEYPLIADQATLDQIDPINHAKPPTTDAEGRITLAALIPGATYRIADRTTAGTAGGPKLRRDFTVKSGETLDVGDILIEKPATRR